MAARQLCFARGCKAGVLVHRADSKAPFVSCARAAADKVNDLQTVALGKFRLSPAVARHNLAIQLHGHAVRLHAQPFHKSREGKDGRKIAEGAFFSIDVQFHGGRERRMHSPLLRFAQQELPRRGASFVVGLDQHRGIRKYGFVNLKPDLGAAACIGRGLGIEGSDLRTSKAKG